MASSFRNNFWRVNCSFVPGEISSFASIFRLVAGWISFLLNLRLHAVWKFALLLTNACSSPSPSSMLERFTSSGKQPRSLKACSASAIVLYQAPLNVSEYSAEHTSFLLLSFWQKRLLLQFKGVLLLLLEEPVMSLPDTILKVCVILSLTELDKPSLYFERLGR